MFDVANNRVQTVLFDRNGIPLSVSRTVFDTLRRPIYTQDRIDVSPTFDPSSQPTTANATRRVYDELGRVVRTEHLHAANLSPILREGALEMRFDGAGRLVRDDQGHEARVDEFISATGVDYDELGRVRSATSSRGGVTRFQYDAAGRRTNVVDELGQSTSYSYDSTGNMTVMTDAAGRSVTNVFDALGRLSQTYFPNGTTQSILYDAIGRRVGEVDAAGVTNRYGYDAVGKLVAVTNAWATSAATWATYGYDELGHQIAQTDALGRTTRFNYDALGRRVSRALPGGQMERFEYDRAGNLIAHTGFAGIVVTNRYNTQNRLLSRHTAGDGTILESFSYTPTGRRQSMSDASGVSTFHYDLAGRLAAIANPNGELHYGYDTAGTVTNIQTGTAGGMSVGYAYDAIGRLTNVFKGGVGNDFIAGYSYDRVGNLSTLVYSNGLQHAYRYDTMNRLTNLVLATLTSTQAAFAYQLDVTGHRTSLAEALNSQSSAILRNYKWQYDPLHRMTNEIIAPAGAGGPVASLAYSYDGVGNRLTRVAEAASLANQHLDYGPNDWLGSDSYDANGNTTIGHAGAAVSSLNCRYDWANRLTNTVIGSKNIAITYDADGHRTRKTVTEGGHSTTTRYLVDDRNPTGYSQVMEENVAVDAGPGALHRVYIYGLDLICQSTSEPESSTDFFGYDGHGSTRLLVGTAGEIKCHFTYDAFGNLLEQPPGSSPTTLYLYAGEQFDPDLGLYYNRARYLNPDTGRFWSMDSFEGSPSEPASLHKYLYCQANPANSRDPSGNETLVEINATTLMESYLQGGLSNVGANLAVHAFMRKRYSLNEAVWDFTTGGILGASGSATKALMGTLGSSWLMRLAYQGGRHGINALLGTAESYFKADWNVAGERPTEFDWTQFAIVFLINYSASVLGDIADTGSGQIIRSQKTALVNAVLRNGIRSLAELKMWIATFRRSDRTGVEAATRGERLFLENIVSIIDRADRKIETQWRNVEGAMEFMLDTILETGAAAAEEWASPE
jgi:RHS repeat-associated protein